MVLVWEVKVLHEWSGRGSTRIPNNHATTTHAHNNQHAQPITSTTQQHHAAITLVATNNTSHAITNKETSQDPRIPPTQLVKQQRNTNAQHQRSSRSPRNTIACFIFFSPSCSQLEVMWIEGRGKSGCASGVYVGSLQGVMGCDIHHCMPLEGF